MNGMLTPDRQDLIVQASTFAAELQQRAATMAQSTASDAGRPFMLLRPRMFADGNQWCALYGENIQEGVCGFGDTPDLASWDFDKNWNGQKLPIAPNGKECAA